MRTNRSFGDKPLFMDLLKYRKLYYLFSGTLIVISVVSLLVWGLNFGIDFTGGSLLEVEYKETRPENQKIKEDLSGLELGETVLQPTGERGLLIRLREVDEATHQKILDALNREQIEEKRFDSIGPVIGKELKEKAQKAVLFVLIAIVLYIAWAFRHVSKPVSSFRYGFIALVALFHDILITAGIFSILGHFLNFEIGIPFVAAILTILGYSVNDTIVVFDRVRENLSKHTGDFQDTVSKSIRETLVRSFNTSLTTLFVLVAIFFLGGETIRYFVLTLIIGIVIGTYSSIFLASPLLVSLKRKLPFGI